MPTETQRRSGDVATDFIIIGRSLDAPMTAPALVSEVLDLQWYHNSLRAWLTAAVTATIVFAGLVLLRRLLISRIGALAARTTNNVDDMFVDVLKETRRWVLARARDLLRGAGR